VLRIMCGTKRLNPFFRLYKASEAEPSPEVFNRGALQFCGGAFSLCGEA